MADTIPGMEAVNLGDGTAATYYRDGSVVIWDITTGERTGGWGAQPNQVAPEGSPGGPPPAPAGAWGAAAPPTPPALGQPVVGTGMYPSRMPGQTVPGRPTDVPFGRTVAPSTWNPADPSQGRGAGWGSIGAGTAGQQYGYGVPGFGQAPVAINPNDLPYLFDSSPGMAPGYIPGSGTYNQFRLDTQNQPPRFPGAPQGLFGPVGPSNTIVNTRYGLGGTGDPTTGGEVQTPRRWITGNPQDSNQAMLGDDAWRRAQTAGR